VSIQHMQLLGGLTSCPNAPESSLQAYLLTWNGNHQPVIAMLLDSRRCYGALCKVVILTGNIDH
jgi:hypothetical protein